MSRGGEERFALYVATTISGHDAWTVGDEACVAVDFGGSSNYAKRQSGWTITFGVVAAESLSLV